MNKFTDFKPDEKRLLESFVEMAKYDTGSNEEVAETQIPSSEGQKVFAEFMAGKLKKMGLKCVNIDNHSVVTATLESNLKGQAPVIGFLAHMDTSPSAKTSDVKPQIHKYKGGNIKLSKDNFIPEEDLKNFVGKTIITSDGTTLLGADDKAGVAAITEAVNILMDNTEIKHPTIKLAITTDEETGAGANKFDIKSFGADAAYTFDGTSPDELCIGNFTAYNPEITITGESYHPGHAYGKTSTIQVRNEIEAKIPKRLKCENAKGKQGYIHIYEDNGTVGKTIIKLLVRDFDKEKVEQKLNLLKKIVAETHEKYPEISINFEEKPVYFNMQEKLNEFPIVVKNGISAIKQTGLIPKKVFARGGTDGAMLSAKNLLTPDIGVGMYNIHSPKEFAVLEEMSLTSKVAVNLAICWTKNLENIMPKIIERRALIK